MDAPLQYHNALPHLFAEYQRTCMPRNSGLREIGNVAECNTNGVFQCVRKVTQTAAQHHTDGGTSFHMGENIVRRSVDFCHQIHFVTSK